MSDVFSEVEEEVRRERWTRLARQWGPWIGGAIAAVLLGVGGWQLYRAQGVRAAQDISSEFAAAQQKLEGGDAKGAAEAFAALQSRGPAAYRQLSGMERAAALVGSGDLQGALAGFDAVAAETNDPILRETARLRAAYIVADTQDFTAVQTRVQPIIDAGGPISYLARELLAVEAWEAGQFDLARQTYEELNLAFDAPEAMRQRASLALQIIGHAPHADADETPAAAGQTNAPAAPQGEKE
ncbi:MAG: tetratricopeptide repeat protein [Hyphomonadaceae bacterium]